MTKRLDWSLRAWNDRQAIETYYASIASTEVAERASAAIREAVLKLADLPAIHRRG